MSPRLEELCIEITGQCLMDCVHCSSSCTPENDIMLSRDKVRELLKDAKLLGAKVIEISGGEPFLHPDLLGIIEDAKRDFEVRIYTSGYVAKGNKCELGDERLLRLHRLGLDKIIFNVEGATLKTHEKLTRTRDSFRSALAGIRSAKKIGIWTGVHFVPMKPNYKELSYIAQLCAKLEVDELAILRFVNQGRGNKHENILALSVDEFRDMIDRVIKLKKIYANTLEIRTGCPLNFCSILDKNNSTAQCKAGMSTLLVGFNGNISLCPAFKHAHTFTLGNVKENTLAEIWENSPILASFRELDIQEIDICNECNFSMTCRGRCVAQRFYEYGDISQGPDPMCPIREGIQALHGTRKLRASR